MNNLEFTPLHKVMRHFRDGHAEQWRAVEPSFLGYGPDKPVRAICAPTDRGTLPEPSTWYLMTNLPLAATSLAEGCDCTACGTELSKATDG